MTNNYSSFLTHYNMGSVREEQELEYCLSLATDFYHRRREEREAIQIVLKSEIGSYSNNQIDEIKDELEDIQKVYDEFIKKKDRILRIPERYRTPKEREDLISNLKSLDIIREEKEEKEKELAKAYSCVNIAAKLTSGLGKAKNLFVINLPGTDYTICVNIFDTLSRGLFNEVLRIADVIVYLNGDEYIYPLNYEEYRKFMEKVSKSGINIHMYKSNMGRTETQLEELLLKFPKCYEHGTYVLTS
jgi:1,2-phenylacetyl-CoA epoxidase PaaB subunit